MLNAITMSHVWVFDQDEALDFYTRTLGLEVSADIDLGFMRWLTVRVPGQPGRDILLELAGPPSVDPDAAEQIRALVAKGATGFTIGFSTEDCRKTYEDLVAKGVEFSEEPTERAYGIDMGLRDPFGNHIRVVQFAPDLNPEDPADLERRVREMPLEPPA